MDPITPILLMLTFWIGASISFSAASGWRCLSVIYPDPSPPPFRYWVFNFSFFHFKLNGFSYGTHAQVVSDALGVHLANAWTHRIWHPPILIPWTALTMDAPKEYSLATAYKAHIAQTKSTITFYGKLGKSIYENWQALQPR